jgi:hypothetical protein
MLSSWGLGGGENLASSECWCGRWRFSASATRASGCAHPLRPLARPYCPRLRKPGAPRGVAPGHGQLLRIRTKPKPKPKPVPPSPHPPRPPRSSSWTPTALLPPAPAPREPPYLLPPASLLLLLPTPNFRWPIVILKLEVHRPSAGKKFQVPSSKPPAPTPAPLPLHPQGQVVSH